MHCFLKLKLRNTEILSSKNTERKLWSFVVMVIRTISQGKEASNMVIRSIPA